MGRGGSGGGGVLPCPKPLPYPRPSQCWLARSASSVQLPKSNDVQNAGEGIFTSILIFDLGRLTVHIAPICVREV